VSQLTRRPVFGIDSFCSAHGGAEVAPYVGSPFGSQDPAVRRSSVTRLQPQRYSAYKCGVACHEDGAAGSDARGGRLAGNATEAASTIRKLKSILQIVDRQPAPALLPILRSQQQGEILALLLGEPDLELSLTEIAARVGAPHPSVYREVQRAEQAGLVASRKVGNTRLVRANTASPYYAGLAEVLTRAFGVPAVLSEVLRDVSGIAAAYIYGSWAARHEGQTGQRPVGDIDVLVLGEPDRDQLYAALSAAEHRLARRVQATIRDRAWLESGSGAFHDTVTSRPIFRLSLPDD
jgi:DNA-binding transcriptional ArsR family regulator